MAWKAIDAIDEWWTIAQVCKPSVKYVNVISIENRRHKRITYYFCATQPLQIKLNVIYVNDLVENNLV